MDGTQEHPAWLADLHVACPPVTEPEQPLAWHDCGELGQTITEALVLVTALLLVVEDGVGGIVVLELVAED